MKKNIAVVGCGHWGKNLIRNFHEIGSLYSVCDPDQSIAESFSKKYEVENLPFRDTISNEKIQGVVIAAPASKHAELAIEAMYAGKNVYVEKPLALNVEDGYRMIAAAKENGVSLMVGHLLQYHTAFQNMLDKVQNGIIGELKYIYSNRLSFGIIRQEEDVIWSFAPHDISMILSLADEAPNQVFTVASDLYNNGNADNATIHLKFNSGLRAHIQVSWIHPYKEQKVVAVGTNGMVVFDDVRKWSEKLAFYPHRMTLKTDGVPQIRKAEVEYIELTEVEPLKAECLHFTEVVNSKTNPRSGGDEGLNVLKVLTAATSSAKKKSSVTLEI